MIEKRIYDGTDDGLTEWIGDRLISWDDHPVIRTGDGDEFAVRPGWYLFRWPDGVVVVSSPEAGRLVADLVDRLQ